MINFFFSYNNKQNNKEPTMLYRVPSLNKPTPLIYFRRFQDNLTVLKQQVESFNKWENDSYALNIKTDKPNQKKRLLKKMTQPKYHKAVVGIIQAYQQSNKNTSQHTTLKNLRSLVFSNKINKTQQIYNQTSFEQPFSRAITTQLSSTQRLKSKQLKLSIKKKQKQLQKQWEKVQSYRSQHSIFNTERSNGKTNKQKMIIRKVMRNKPTLSTDLSQFCTRNHTFQSECLQIR